jgi:RND superfamily putative drug exporter
MKLLRGFARFTHRRRTWILVVFMVALAAAAIYGSRAAHSLTAGGFEDPKSESARATRVLEEVFDVGQPDVVAVYAHDELRATDPAFRRALGSSRSKRSNRSFPPKASPRRSEAPYRERFRRSGQRRPI